MVQKWALVKMAMNIWNKIKDTTLYNSLSKGLYLCTEKSAFLSDKELNLEI
jgi:hypothetical protein